MPKFSIARPIWAPLDVQMYSDWVAIRQSKYGLVAEAIRAQLANGKYAVGQYLPSEVAIAVSFGVSRMTVRQALEILESDQLIRRIHGRGTLVIGTSYQRSISGLRGLAEDLTEAGQRPGAKVLSFARTTADRFMADELGLSIGESLVEFVRLRTSNGKPFGLQHTHVPAKWVPNLVAADLEDASLYALLEGHYALRLVSSTQRIGARAASEEEADRLSVPVGSPLFVVHRVTTLDSGDCIENMIGLYRADLVSYTSVLQRQSSPTAQQEPRLLIAL